MNAGKEREDATSALYHRFRDLGVPHDQAEAAAIEFIGKLLTVGWRPTHVPSAEAWKITTGAPASPDATRKAAAAARAKLTETLHGGTKPGAA